MDKPTLSPEELKQLRRQARARSIVLPGVGLALLGHRRKAWLVLAPSIVGIGAIYALVIWPCEIGFWTLAGSALAALVASTYEYRAVGHLDVFQLPSADRQRRSRLACWISVFVAAITLWIACANFRFVVVEIDAMSPTVIRGDVLMCSKYDPPGALRQGKLIVFDKRREKEIGRVRAVPGDKLSWDGPELLVNGVKTGQTTGIDTVEHPIPPEPATYTVPEQKYLVVREGDNTGEWISPQDVISSRLLMLLGKKGLGVGVDQ